MPNIELDYGLVIPKAAHQVNVYVKNPAGKPLPNAKVTVHRALDLTAFAPFLDWEKILPHASTVTDSEGYAYFDGLLPWFYALAVEHEEQHLSAPPKMFTVPIEVVPPYTAFTFNLKATPPPHLYEVRINFGLDAIAGAVGWVTEHLPQLTEAVVGAGGKFVKYYTDKGWLVLQFRIESSPAWYIVVAAILAILIVLAILGWEVKEIVEKAPPAAWNVFKWGLIAAVAAVAVGGGAYAVHKFKK